MSKQNEFCHSCLMGIEESVKEQLALDSSLANARGEVHPDYKAYMEKQGSAGGWTALHLAAHYGQPAIVKLLLNAGADTAALSDNREGNTPLMAAVAGNRLDIAKQLLLAGADPLALDKQGKLNALALAEGQKKTAFVELFQKLS